MGCGGRAGYFLASSTAACCSGVMQDTNRAFRAPGQPPEARRFAVRSSVVDEAREVGGQIYYPHELTMLGRAADFQMRLKATDLSAVTVGLLEYSSPVRIRTGPLQDAYQVNMPLQGRLKLTYGKQTVLASPRVAAIHGLDRETCVEGWQERAPMLGLKIPCRLVDKELAALLDRAPEKPVEFSGALDLAGRAGQEWRQAVELLVSGLRGSDTLLANPLIAGPAVQAVIRGLLLAAPNNYTAELTGETSAVDSAAVRRAVDFIETHAHLPVTLEDIAARACVSPRSLQLGFRTHLNATPIQVLRATRLRKAREELLAAGPQARIGEIAARWGFAHAGRFSIQYAKTFGEAPSETLKKPGHFR
jgi:AraC-like DNA-binding protein